MRRATRIGKKVENALSYFYPRSPCGERQSSEKSTPEEAYFYPRSPCGERPTGTMGKSNRAIISIHALLAESDVFLLRKITITVDISIHALLAESDVAQGAIAGD